MHDDCTRDVHSPKTHRAVPFYAFTPSLPTVRSQFIAVTAAQQSSAPVTNALADAFRYIAAHDFPDRWPTLVQSLNAALCSGDLSSTLAALRLLRVFAYHYHLKKVPGGGPMAIMCHGILSLVHQVAQFLIANHNTVEAASAIHLALKFYYSTIEYQLGRYPSACNSSSFIAWCGLCNSVLVKVLDPAALPAMADSDTRAAWPWWKAKKWAAKIVACIAEKYGKPSDFDDDTDEEAPALKALAVIFNKNIAPEVVSTALVQLAAWTSSGGAVSSAAWLSPRVRQAYLSLISSASDFSSVWKPLQPHMPLLIEGVIFSLLRPTAEDIEEFENDPEQWLVSQDDILMSYTSPACAAEHLLRVLAEKRHATTLPIVDRFIRGTCEAYAAVAPASRDHGAKDAVMRMLVVIASTYEEKRKGRTRAALESLLTNFVTPELAPEALPLLRVRAMHVWSAFSDVKGVPDDAKVVACRGM